MAGNLVKTARCDEILHVFHRHSTLRAYKNATRVIDINGTFGVRVSVSST